MRRLGDTRVLVVCPKAVVPVWGREATKYLGENAPPVLALTQDGTKAKAEALGRMGDGIVVVNYESAWRDPLAKAIEAWAPAMLIIDELHRIKSPTGRASKWLGALASTVGHRLGLTGTPLAHGPLDIWAEYRAVAPRVYGGTYSQFRMRYLRPAMMNEWPDKDVMITAGRGGALQRWKLHRMDELEAKAYLIAHRVKVADVLDLPESTDTTWEVDLEPEAKRVYREIEDDFIAQVGAGAAGGVVTAANAMTVALRLAQVTGGTVKDEEGREHRVSEAKEKLLAELLEDMKEAGEPVVVFGRFHSDLDAIHSACRRAGMTSGELSGRRSDLAAWQDGETDVLVAQVQSGSVGIDLVRARIAIWFSLDYNAANHEQARARVLRAGQTRNVQYHYLTARGTVDGAVLAALANRKSIVDAIVDRLGLTVGV